MIIRKLRLQHGWSQEQLAEMSGLSARTIQRIERGQSPSLESAKSLASVFNIDFNDLIEDDTMISTPEQKIDATSLQTRESHQVLSEAEAEAIEYVRDIKQFYINVACYVIVIPILAAIDVINSPEKLWFYWPALGWGFGLIFHGLNVFEVFNWFSPDWERKRIEKRLGRKL